MKKILFPLFVQIQALGPFLGARSRDLLQIPPIESSVRFHLTDLVTKEGFVFQKPWRLRVCVCVLRLWLCLCLCVGCVSGVCHVCVGCLSAMCRCMGRGRGGGCRQECIVSVDFWGVCVSTGARDGKQRCATTIFRRQFHTEGQILLTCFAKTQVVAMCHGTACSKYQYFWHAEYGFFIFTPISWYVSQSNCYALTPFVHVLRQASHIRHVSDRCNGRVTN